METFVTWATEKRELDESLVVGTLATGAVAAFAYWHTKGQKKRDQNKDVLVHRKSGVEDDKEMAFDGSTVVKMYDAREIDDNDWFTPPGAQNWMKIGDSIKKNKYLPWNKSILVGKKTLRAQDDTKWLAAIDGEKKRFNSSQEFAAAIAKGDIDTGTLVWHNGYKSWKKYGDRDVDDDIAPYLAKETPHKGDMTLMDSPTKYNLRGTATPINFEDLAGIGLADDAYVWVKDYKNAWIRFKEIKKKLPKLGQAHRSNPRGKLARAVRWLGGKRVTTDAPKTGGWETGKKTTPTPTPAP